MKIFRFYTDDQRYNSITLTKPLNIIDAFPDMRKERIFGGFYLLQNDPNRTYPVIEAKWKYGDRAKPDFVGGIGDTVACSAKLYYASEMVMYDVQPIDFELEGDDWVLLNIYRICNALKNKAALASTSQREIMKKRVHSSMFKLPETAKTENYCLEDQTPDPGLELRAFYLDNNLTGLLFDEQTVV